jgi:phenylalanyl-tRNA synthetase alpha chain
MNSILTSARELVNNAGSLSEIRQIKIDLLGKSSLLSAEMKKLATIPQEERKKFGEEINKIRVEIEQIINDKTLILEELDLAQKLESQKLDLSLPTRYQKKGSIHPITQCKAELIEIFSRFGFVIKEGPNIETDWYNFTALNIDELHPARQMHDTFYLKNGKVLRTHTSPTQIRVMQESKPPLRIISPGRTYRSDSDTTHTPMFHQIEGFVIDEDINMGHLKYVIIEFIKEFFENSAIETRFRPSFFPFTEPSAEVDIRIKPSDPWLEVLGCGMIHPNVLANCNISCEEFGAFAFGLGIERFAMLKYGIDDLRQFFEGDIRWLNHYNFATFDIPSFTGGLSR